MLHQETVEPRTLELLKQLQAEPLLLSFIWYILLQRFSQCNHNPSINPLIYNFSPQPCGSPQGFFRFNYKKKGGEGRYRESQSGKRVVSRTVRCQLATKKEYNKRKKPSLDDYFSKVLVCLIFKVQKRLDWFSKPLQRYCFSHFCASQNLCCATPFCTFLP